MPRLGLGGSVGGFLGSAIHIVLLWLVKINFFGLRYSPFASCASGSCVVRLMALSTPGACKVGWMAGPAHGGSAARADLADVRADSGIGA